jgi:hypothetical protein
MGAVTFVGGAELSVEFGVEFTACLLEYGEIEGVGGADLETLGWPVVENRRSRLVVDTLRSEKLMMTTLL